MLLDLPFGRLDEVDGVKVVAQLMVGQTPDLDVILGVDCVLGFGQSHQHHLYELLEYLTVILFEFAVLDEEVEAALEQVEVEAVRIQVVFEEPLGEVQVPEILQHKLSILQRQIGSDGCIAGKYVQCHIEQHLRIVELLAPYLQLDVPQKRLYVS